MDIPRMIFSLLLPLAIIDANANSQKLELVVGQTEVVDLRYGYEWPYLGVAITPGLGLFIASKVRAEEGLPTSWNPSISLYKTMQLNERINIVPNLAFTYWYGSEGMVGQITCPNCGEIQTRGDVLYFKGGTGFQYKFGHLFIEVNPGLTSHLNYTYVLKGNASSVRRNNENWIFDGVYLSGSIGFQLGEN